LAPETPATASDLAGKARPTGRDAAALVVQTGAMAAIAAFSAAPCFALPDGARVRGGGIEFSNPDPATLQIRQQQRRGAVDFNSFNIRANERVLIQQPDAKSLFLGRVVGGLGPSKIDGLLKANGGGILLNPQGLLIGPSGSVNTASFMASTLDANPEQFLSGGPLRLWKPVDGPADGQILNQGSISVAEGGLAALVGANISNEGLISARMGTVVLASGQSATLDVNGDGLITLAVSDEVLNSLINQQGTIQAPGGDIWIGASHLGGALTSVVNVGGTCSGQLHGGVARRRSGECTGRSDHGCRQTGEAPGHPGSTKPRFKIRSVEDSLQRSHRRGGRCSCCTQRGEPAAGQPVFTGIEQW